MLSEGRSRPDPVAQQLADFFDGASVSAVPNFTLLHYDKENLPIGETRGLVAFYPCGESLHRLWT